MADDHNSPYRSHDPSSREPAQAEPANDPLVELARLIGRSDPFTDIPRGPRVPSSRDTSFRSEPAPHYDHQDATDAGSESSPRYDAPPMPRFGADHVAHYRDDNRGHDEWPGTPAPAPAPAPTHAQSYGEPDPFRLPLRPRTPMAAAPSEPSEPPFEMPNFPLRAPPSMEGFQPDRTAPQAAAYPAEPELPPFPRALYPDEPEGGQMPPPHEDEFYDDAPRGGRRKGVLTVAAVLGLAIIGTAGAFAYRTYFSGARVSSPPPVIRASGEPSKVAPPPADADQSPAKINYDRFGDRGKDEQVVVREEKPVDTRELGRTTVPRTVFPPPPVLTQPQGGGTVASSAAPAAAPAAAPSALGEPRRVRTVPIRPDQPAASTAPQSIATAAPMPVAPQRQSEVEPPPAVEPMPAPAARAAPPPAPSARGQTRVASRAASPPAATANAPLSLNPNSTYQPSPPAAPEAPRAAAPTRLASAPASRGGYLVQVSSQRSEADAETAFRNIQAKYSSVLGGQPHLVRRADLGGRGIYYRAMVGPFGTRAQALQLCTSLKAAGGDCVVQSN